MLPLSGFVPPITWPEDNQVQDRNALSSGVYAKGSRLQMLHPHGSISEVL